MDIRPIKTRRDYANALRRIEALMSAQPGTDEGDELDVLATLVEVYEQKHFPVHPADPVEAILFRMEQQGLKRGSSTFQVDLSTAPAGLPIM